MAKRKYQSPFEFWAERLSHARTLAFKTKKGRDLVRFPLPHPLFTAASLKAKVLRVKPIRKVLAIHSGIAHHACFLDEYGTELHRITIGDPESPAELMLSFRRIYKGAQSYIDNLIFTTPPS